MMQVIFGCLAKGCKATGLMVCLLSAVLTLHAKTGTVGIPVVVNGASKYSIVLSPVATENERKAAALLQKYVLEISGCALPIGTLKSHYEISITASDKIMHRDGFSIVAKDNDVVIAGGVGKGCIYGVVCLLEKYMNCHYYSYAYKVVPRQKNITLPAINYTDQPANDCRIVNVYDAASEEFLDWNRLNTIDEVFAAGYYVHTFNKLVPWQEYFKPHPEYFAMQNGKRVIDQLCLSNPEVLEVITSKLKDEMKLQPDKVYWSVSQNDNYTYCHCDKCQRIIDEEKSPSGPVIRLVNKVAERFPDKIISTLAYQYSRAAPVVTKPLSNVQVMLCTIELDRSKPIEQEAGSQSFVKDIVDWGKICKRIYLWDYTIDFAHSVSPFPNLHVLQPNIQFFCRNNVNAHFQQSNISTGHEFSDLKLYLISRLLWHPDVNVDKLTNAFLTGYYGAAGKWIRKYIDQLEAQLKLSNSGLDIYGHPVVHQHDFLSSKNVAQYNDYFDKAEQAVSGNKELLLHVKVARLPLQYAIMEIGKNDMFGPRGWYIQKGNDFVLNAKMKTMLDTFYATCRRAKVADLTESGLTPTAYYESTLRFIDIQVKGNLAFRKKVTATPLPSSKYSGGDLSFLTNGVRGANDFKVHWLGWDGTNVALTLDMEHVVNADSIEISTLWDAKSWILHPAAITCMVSENGKDFLCIGELLKSGDQQKEELTTVWKFRPGKLSFRYVKFEVKGTMKLFDWHPSAGGSSWGFIDEIVVK